MAEDQALEIVMRQIAEAARTGDLRKVEEGLIVARALEVSPQANSASTSTSKDRSRRVSTFRDTKSSLSADPTAGAPNASRDFGSGDLSPNSMPKRREGKERGRIARQWFFSKLSSNGITFTHIRNREYKTSNGKRFAVAFATEDPRGDLWWSGSENGQYDAIVLLCTASDGTHLDFIVPWSSIASNWSNFSRSRDNHVKFHVKRNASGYALDIPHAIGLTITSFLSNLAPLRG